MALSMLPDLTPRDPHSLWYTARHPPTTAPHNLLDPSHPHDPTTASHHNQHQHQHHPRDRDARRALLARTPLARLRHDEAVMDRRRANVANYGTQWLKPPGVAKTLFQLREERREAEEHAEAMRREHTLAAQLAEAAAEQEGGGGGGGGGGTTMMEDGDADGVDEVDLDGEIPEAEGFGFDGEDSEVEEMESDDELEETTGNNAGVVMVSPVEEAQVREVRAAEDRLMNLMAHDNGASVLGEAFREDEERAREEEMLEEDDLVSIMQPTSSAAENADVSMGMDMDMDADLDGEIPDGDDHGDEYEHTDSDEEIDESTREISFVGPSSAMTRPRRLRRSVHRSSLRSRGSLAQSEVLDISELLSGEGSSFMEASPYPRRRG
ncbi:unnamed protein product [Discula destructiva]